VSRARTVLSNGQYYLPAAFLEPEDVGGMIRLLGARSECPSDTPTLNSFVGLAKALLLRIGINLEGDLRSRFQALELQLSRSCHAVFALRNLAHERCRAATHVAPSHAYSIDEDIRWAAYAPGSVDDVVRAGKDEAAPGIPRHVALSPPGSCVESPKPGGIVLAVNRDRFQQKAREVPIDSNPLN